MITPAGPGKRAPGHERHQQHTPGNQQHTQAPTPNLAPPPGLAALSSPATSKPVGLVVRGHRGESLRATRDVTARTSGGHVSRGPRSRFTADMPTLLRVFRFGDGPAA
jgi:hypothetical protein